jgi:DNA end-binding protein Ku
MAKSVWKGSISIGLVNIPVNLQTAVRESRVEFHQITPCCGQRVAQVLRCKGCGKEVSRSEVRKGWELGDGKFVVLEQAELDAVRLRSVKSICVEGFVEGHLIDPIQMATSYYIVPQEGAEKAYNLIAQALFMKGLYGLARITAHGKEHIAVMRAKAKGTGVYLVLTTLWYPDEVLAPPDIPTAVLSEREIELARQLLEGYVMEKLDLAQYRNRYVEALKELINAKMLGQPTAAVEQPEPAMDLEKALMVSIKARAAG